MMTVSILCDLPSNTSNGLSFTLAIRTSIDYAVILSLYYFVVAYILL